MLVFKPSQKFLLLPPKIFPTTTTTTTNSKPNLHHLHHHDVKLHFSPLKAAHFKSTLSSSSSLPLSPPQPQPQPPSDSSSLTTTTADFLMESCGLSYVEAIQVIQQVPSLLKNGGRKPRSVIAYFESIGFSKTHISKAISKCPRLLVSDVETTLKPKIQLFVDFGFSKSDIADLMSSCPTLLRTGVKTQMKPGLDLIKRFVKTDADLIKIIKHYGFFLLRFTHRRNYIEATWDSKIDLLKGGLGWSDEQILDAFTRHPMFLMLSREYLKEGIEFFKESLNWDASVLSRYPIVLCYSLKRRVIPRYAVLKCLMSQHIIKEDMHFKYMLKLNETEFLSKYVFKYQHQLPYLYEVYKKECMLGCEKNNGLIFNQQDHGDVDMTV